MNHASHTARQLLARQLNEKRIEKRRKKMLPVAEALRSPDLRGPIIENGWKQIRKWRELQLCSSDYISAWELLLNDPERAAAVLEEKSQWANQLRQNCPFVLPLLPSFDV